MKQNILDVIELEDLKKLIMSIANKKNFYNVDKHDLYQAGYIGALKALDNYNKDSNTKFSTYAYLSIFGEMYEFAKNDRNIKISKNYISLRKQIENARNILTQKFNREPSINELSRFLEIDLNTINSILKVPNTTTSLDSITDLDNESNLYTFLGKSVDYDTKILVRDSLECLNEDEYKVINYRYYYDYTQQEIADMMGINQVKVSRLETSSKRKIKEYINA